MNKNDVRAIISLREYIDFRFTELDRRLDLEKEANQKALVLAREENQRHLQQLNEFRAQIMEERNLFARKAEIELRLKPLESGQSYQQGSSHGKEFMIGIIAAIVVAVVSLILNLT